MFAYVRTLWDLFVLRSLRALPSITFIILDCVILRHPHYGLPSLHSQRSLLRLALRTFRHGVGAMTASAGFAHLVQVIGQEYDCASLHGAVPRGASLWCRWCVSLYGVIWGDMVIGLGDNTVIWAVGGARNCALYGRRVEVGLFAIIGRAHPARRLTRRQTSTGTDGATVIGEENRRGARRSPKTPRPATAFQRLRRVPVRRRLVSSRIHWLPMLTLRD